jgi:hypothetical protein
MSSTNANCLLYYAIFAILRWMTNGGRRPRRKARPTFKGRPNDLGALLADLRTAKGLSLREVEEASDKAVSNAYLSQFENGKIKKPSPNVLQLGGGLRRALRGVDGKGRLLVAVRGQRDGAPQKVGCLRDRRSDCRRRRRAPQVPGVHSLPQLTVMKVDHERVLPPTDLLPSNRSN